MTKQRTIRVVRGEIIDILYADQANEYASRDRLVLMRGEQEVAWYRLSAIDGWLSDEALEEDETNGAS